MNMLYVVVRWTMVLRNLQRYLYHSLILIAAARAPDSHLLGQVHRQWNSQLETFWISETLIKQYLLSALLK